jgi:hypothetical protein
MQKEPKTKLIPFHFSGQPTYYVLIHRRTGKVVSGKARDAKGRVIKSA